MPWDWPAVRELPRGEGLLRLAHRARGPRGAAPPPHRGRAPSASARPPASLPAERIAPRPRPPGGSSRPRGPEPSLRHGSESPVTASTRPFTRRLRQRLALVRGRLPPPRGLPHPPRTTTTSARPASTAKHTMILGGQLHQLRRRGDRPRPLPLPAALLPARGLPRSSTRCATGTTARVVQHRRSTAGSARTRERVPARPQALRGVRARSRTLCPPGVAVAVAAPRAPARRGSAARAETSARHATRALDVGCGPGGLPAPWRPCTGR